MQLVYDPQKAEKTMCNLPIAVDSGCNCRDDRESPCDCYSQLEGAEIQRNADLTVCQSLLDALELLIKVQGCTCGAKPESPQTHPHVLRCKIAEAINRAKGQLLNI